MLIEIAKALSGELQLSSKFGQWILAASKQLDDLANVSKIDIWFPTVRVVPGDSPPTAGSIGPTTGWTFVNGNRVYIESPLLPNRDLSKNLILGIGWAPTGDEPTKTARWQADLGFMSIGKNISTIDATETADAPAGGFLLYQHTLITIPPADWLSSPAADELHARVQLVTSGNDPASPPGLHHVAVIQALLSP